jgi:putative transposase
MARKKKETNRVDEMLADCQTPEDILGESGLLKQLSKRLIERALAGELNHHLKDEKATELEETTSERLPRGNSRNGYSKKTIQSDHGEMDLAIPRDRQGEFEPVLVPKHQRRLAGLDEKILVLYARGLSTRDSICCGSLSFRPSVGDESFIESCLASKPCWNFSPMLLNDIFHPSLLSIYPP